MKKILIVDDEESILISLSLILSNEKTVVVAAKSIEEAETALAKHSFDLMIADVRLSGMCGTEGLELLNFVKRNSSGTEVIIMTGYGSHEMESVAYEYGAAHYFEKPVDFEVLINSVRSLGINVSGFRQ